MFRYHLRTLLILVIVLPPLLAWVWFVFDEFRMRQNERAEWEGELSLIHGSGQRIEPEDDTNDLPPD
jgi:hypothetical protein